MTIFPTRFGVRLSEHHHLAFRFCLRFVLVLPSFFCPVCVFVSQDKRREVGARTHAAARAREDAADGLDMKEADTMGGGDSFRDALARTKHSQKRRQTAKTVRVHLLVDYTHIPTYIA